MLLGLELKQWLQNERIASSPTVCLNMKSRFKQDMKRPNVRSFHFLRGSWCPLQYLTCCWFTECCTAASNKSQASSLAVESVSVSSKGEAKAQSTTAGAGTRCSASRRVRVWSARCGAPFQACTARLTSVPAAACRLSKLQWPWHNPLPVTGRKTVLQKIMSAVWQQGLMKEVICTAYAGRTLRAGHEIEHAQPHTVQAHPTPHTTAAPAPVLTPMHAPLRPHQPAVPSAARCTAPGMCPCA